MNNGSIRASLVICATILLTAGIYFASPVFAPPKTAPTADRIPGAAPADDFMHAQKWKQEATETEATLKEIRRKASRIAPAYNKGALQYWPDDDR